MPASSGTKLEIFSDNPAELWYTYSNFHEKIIIYIYKNSISIFYNNITWNYFLNLQTKSKQKKGKFDKKGDFQKPKGYLDKIKPSSDCLSKDLDNATVQGTYD